MNRRIAGLSREARALLMNYDWPGNVRELENAIEHAAVLGSREQILAEDLPESILECDDPTDAAIARYHEGVKEAKRQLIVKAFEDARGNHPPADAPAGPAAGLVHFPNGYPGRSRHRRSALRPRILPPRSCTCRSQAL